MQLDPVLIYALIFVAVLTMADTLLRSLFAARRVSRDVKNRLEGLKQTRGTDIAYNELLARRGFFSGDGNENAFGWLRNLYAQSGLEFTPARRISYLLLFFLFGWVFAAQFISGLAVVQIGFGLLLSPALALAIMYYARRKRVNKFVSQLAPALDIIVRSLNAGHPLTSAFSLVAKEMPDPIGSEFGVLSDQLTFGAALDTAMLHMYRRVGADELNLVAVTVSVQKGTGGNLSEILENLAGMIRDRLLLKAKIRAISSEGRIAAAIMSVFPFFLFLMIKTMVPTYFDTLWESGYGTIVVSVVLFVMGVGILILNRLVNFDF